MSEKQKIIERKFHIVNQLSEVPTGTYFLCVDKIYYHHKDKFYFRLLDNNYLQQIYKPDIEAIDEAGKLQILEPVEFVFEEKIIR